MPVDLPQAARLSLLNSVRAPAVSKVQAPGVALEELTEADQHVILKKLAPKHKEAMALLAQGVDRVTIGSMVGYTPEYITWLAKQPLCLDYLRGIAAFADAQLIGMTSDSVEAIRDVLKEGAPEDRLKAARLQMEATGRIGPRAGQHQLASPAEEKLGQLASRLEALLVTKQTEAIDGTARKVPDEEIIP